MASYKETLIKTIIWRSIATSITIFSGWLISGSWKFGLAVGGIDTILKSSACLFYSKKSLKKKGVKKIIRLLSKD